MIVFWSGCVLIMVKFVKTPLHPYKVARALDTAVSNRVLRPENNRWSMRLHWLMKRE